MEIKLSNPEMVSKEKVLFVEDQANRLLEFAMESRGLLNREAHSTLNWLFSMIIGSAGYLLKIAGDESHQAGWAVTVIGVVLIASTASAIRLFHFALRTASVLPPGNEPKNLVTDEQMAYEEHLIRLSSACQLQERIEGALAYNAQVGDAVNLARWSIAIIAGTAGMLVIICRSIFG